MDAGIVSDARRAMLPFGGKFNAAGRCRQASYAGQELELQAKHAEELLSEVAASKERLDGR